MHSPGVIQAQRLRLSLPRRCCSPLHRLAVSSGPWSHSRSSLPTAEDQSGVPQRLPGTTALRTAAPKPGEPQTLNTRLPSPAAAVSTPGIPAVYQAAQPAPGGSRSALRDITSRAGGGLREQEPRPQPLGHCQACGPRPCHSAAGSEASTVLRGWAQGTSLAQGNAARLRQHGSSPGTKFRPRPFSCASSTAGLLLSTLRNGSVGCSGNSYAAA